MPQILPLPTLDHVVVNVRDRIDAGAECYRRLGFTLTPRGYHTLGSTNHLAIFGTDYLELIAAPAGETRRPEILEAPEGLNGLVFGSEDAAATYAVMRDAGVPVEPFEQFSRPVQLADGPQDAAFRTVRLTPGTVAIGRLYFCQHLTRNLVWRDEWRHHPNGTTGVEAAVISAIAPSELADLFRQMFGDDAVRAIAGGYTLTLGVSRFDILTPEMIAESYGAGMPDGGGRDSFMAALLLRTRGLDMAASALAEGQIVGVRRDARRIVVPANQAFGAALVFVE
jgi:hypothetical protein